MSRFVVLEGLDGAGTTTQTARLCTWLEGLGRSVLPTREPTEGPVGRIIRATLRGDADAPAVGTLPWLFAADRADHLHRRVEPALARGTWVVSDRYYHSSLAYQSLTQPLEVVAALNAPFRTPDLTLFLQVPVADCLRRIEGRAGQREIYEQQEQMEQIAARYEVVLAHLEARGEPILRLDGTAGPDAVAAAVREAVRPLL